VVLHSVSGPKNGPHFGTVFCEFRAALERTPSIVTRVSLESSCLALSKDTLVVIWGVPLK